MKLFTCGACQQVVFFENVHCTQCGHALAYLPDHAVVSAIERVEGTGAEGEPAVFVALAPEAKGARYRLCRNSIDHEACNWMIPAAEEGDFCKSCRFNEIIPNLADAHAREAWRRIERAKRRLFYTLLAFGLPLEEKSRDEGGLAFVFKADDGPSHVLTGHSEGVITLNIAEADDPFREKMRLQMGEAYRTLLGHFRHEIGHYYWSRLIDQTPLLEPCRSLFGDERADYAAAMQHHYDQGAPADWGLSFVSAYASMHPWEDWAETWAHYLHMVDTLETARSYGLALKPRPVGGSTLGSVTARRLHFDDFDDLIAAWVPLTLALNSFNRSMGLLDLYPFVLSAKAVEKLRFVHDAIEKSEGTHGLLEASSPG